MFQQSVQNAENVRHGAENVHFGAKSVRHGAKNVHHGAKICAMVPKICVLVLQSPTGGPSVENLGNVLGNRTQARSRHLKKAKSPNLQCFQCV